MLRLDDGLVTGPEEVMFPNGFDQPAAFHHVAGVIVDTGEHQRAALFVQTLVQAVNGFDTCCIDQRYATHRQDQRVCIT